MVSLRFVCRSLFEVWPLMMLVGCESELNGDAAGFRVLFTCESDRAASDQLRLVLRKGSCTGLVVYDETLRRGETPKPSAALTPGDYAYEAIALQEGRPLAHGCTVGRLPDGPAPELWLASERCLGSREGAEPIDTPPPTNAPNNTPNSPPPMQDSGATTLADAALPMPACDGGGAACEPLCPNTANTGGLCNPPPQSLVNGCTSQRFAGHDYLFCGDRKLWNLARQRCQSLGMGLVSIENAEENAFVRDHAGGADRWIGANDLGQNDLPLFLNLTLDLREGVPLGADSSCRLSTGNVGEGNWYWASKTSQVSNAEPICTFASAMAEDCVPTEGGYQNWGAAQPNNAGCACAAVCLPGQDCALLHADDGTWDDQTCGFVSAAYVCESL